jgi:ABC-type multidrug transport system fused ATPase/permease subunit
MSGGQRQRLGLARALVGQKSVLILDEATSALDSESEAPIVQAIRDLKGRMTIIVIAHRLSTVRHADEILVLESGRLVERGAWNDLIVKNGVFARLWRLQSTTDEGSASSLESAR